MQNTIDIEPNLARTVCAARLMNRRLILTQRLVDGFVAAVGLFGLLFVRSSVSTLTIPLLFLAILLLGVAMAVLMDLALWLTVWKQRPVVSKAEGIVLPKAAFTPQQRAEFAAFLGRLPVAAAR